MQTGEDAARIVRLGADANKVSVVGSLKWAGAPPPSSQFGDVPRHGKKLLIAGSTHAGEEQILLACFAILRPRFPQLSMVLRRAIPSGLAKLRRS